MSKGSKPRPIDREVYNDNFDKIFGPVIYKSLKPDEEEEKPKYHSKSEKRRKESKDENKKTD